MFADPGQRKNGEKEEAKKVRKTARKTTTRLRLWLSRNAMRGAEENKEGVERRTGVNLTMQADSRREANNRRRVGGGVERWWRWRSKEAWMRSV